MDCNACFSEIFKEQTFGKLNLEESDLFITRTIFESQCNTCNQKVIMNSNIFATFVTRRELNKYSYDTLSWPSYLSHIYTQPGKLSCAQCEEFTDDPMIKSVSPSHFLFVEFAIDVMSELVFFERIQVGDLHYVLKSLVRCYHSHFTCAIKANNGAWIYIDDMSTSVQEFSTLNILHQFYQDGWFFTIYEFEATTEPSRTSSSLPNTASNMFEAFQTTTTKQE